MWVVLLKGEIEKAPATGSLFGFSYSMGLTGWRRGLLILWEIEVNKIVNGANGGIGFGGVC